MTIEMNIQDRGVLYGMLAELGGDIVVRTDIAGFIEHASVELDQLGFAVSDMLIAPHLADLSADDHTDAVRTYCEQAIRGTCAIRSIEFPICTIDAERRWYSLSLRPLRGQDDQLDGALGVLRCVDQARALEDRLFESVLTDPMTGIPNRQSFLSQVGRLMEQGRSGCVALFEIDRLRAIRLRFGQRASDSVVVAFAGYLRTMLDEGHILARLEDNRFAVMMPDATRNLAIDVASEAVSTFAEISGDADLEEMRLTASASVTTLGSCLDETLMRGEVALTIARSAGGYRVECGDAIRQGWRSSRRA